MINKVLILEDEKPNADRLQRLIKVIKPQVEIVGVLESIADCVTWMNTHPQPDVIMMDVRLADGLSFEIFDKVIIHCPIVFTTAYDEYAVKAFKYNSVDYLLKPVVQEELAQAFDKLDHLSPGATPPSLEGLLNYLQPKEYRTRFLLPYRDGYKSVLVNEVAYFFSELKISRAKLVNGETEIIPQSLEELEQQLNPKQFFRANRQFIIHIDAIKQIHNSFNGKLKVEIKNSPTTEIIVSREKAQLLKAWMDY
ncbi:LytTR family two component transcriptional regulator [Chitinophaga skermanii]|uniref:LytTR family two component transcriptional regulator n=1 Tax=Chitinophaga skermanii TaxID=331697 RepID=A0A327QZJ1_9BACT|nr:LytTR family DNA-binding domain-containing protein [Chitinophaga skermanii]RAJ08863.1 LytTR family two component transcriptional regulator [Chitinophaga skermanii]